MKINNLVLIQFLSLMVSGKTLPPGLQNIHVEVTVAGRTFYEVLPPVAEQKYTFNWDGMDAYGRKVRGTQPARVRVGYDYGYVAAYARVAGGTSNQRTFGVYANIVKQFLDSLENCR